MYFTGKTAVVTGANSGIGLECSRQLLDLGLSKLIILAHPSAIIGVWKLDLSSNDSILAFVERTKALDRLDFVVHNAGVVLVKQLHNKSTHHDEVIQVNYLSTALLTLLWLPVLKTKNPSGAGRLVIVSSDVAKEGYDHDRHFTSKLLGQLFIAELVKRVPASYGVADPGLCYGAGLNRESDGIIAGYIFAIVKRLVGYSCAAGARQLTDAAVKHGEEYPGQYVEEGKVLPMAPLVYTSEGEKIAERLWDETMAKPDSAHVGDIVKGISK
ncbi:NAD(P)-binding protein [Poronia punctata]|nr:NAD(P)-binding protein [Poronia punctata]